MTILQNHLINNLSAQDTFPSYKVLMGSIESFIEHYTTTTVTLHTKLLKIVFPSCQNLQFLKSNNLFVNPSTPRPEGQGLLRVDLERRFFTSPSKGGLALPKGSSFFRLPLTMVTRHSVTLR
jgi:hypothetical protein